jgi:RHS repeat-associated protein
MTPGSGTALSYSFDPSGNLTTLPTGATGTYDKAGELTSANMLGSATSYTYNADGEQLTAKQGGATLVSATWNGADQLTSYAGTAASMTTASYDGDGVRSSSSTTPVGRGTVTEQYTWDTQTQIPQLIMDSQNAYIYGSGTAPDEEISLATGTVTYLIADALGSVRSTVNDSGTMTGMTGYDAWGNPQTTGGLAAATPFGYAGSYTDPSGLLYLVNRYYNPQTGSFLSADPLVDATMQEYEYANDDPVRITDPSGMCWFCLIESVHWEHEDTGPRASDPWAQNMLEISVSTLARLLTIPAEDPITWVALNIATLNEAWKDVVKMAGRRANTGTMHSQFVCHWVLVREKPGRNFHLERWRPDRGIWGDLRDRCNPV